MGDPYQYEINHMEKTRLIGEAFDLVCAAQAASTREHWTILSARFDEQMEDWREIGSGDGARTRWKDNDEDDALWEEFSGHRDEFKELRDDWFDDERARRKRELQPLHQRSAAAKRMLVEKVKALVGGDPFEADKAAETLFAEWKQAGHAGDEEAALWAGFNESRRQIKDRKRAVIDGRRAKQETAAKAKRDIIAETARLCEGPDLDAAARRTGELHRAWKAAGSAGKGDPALWEEFTGWTDRIKKRRAALQRGEPDPFPPPVAAPPVEAAERDTGAAPLHPMLVPAVAATGAAEGEPAAGAAPEARRLQPHPAFRLGLALVAFGAALLPASPIAERAPPQRVAATAQIQTPPPPPNTTATGAMPCVEYQAARARSGRPYEVGCNAKTAAGFYWKVKLPRIRPYGYWGMRGVGATPPCRTAADIGKGAETAAFKTASAVWEMRAYWCRQSEQHKDCHGRRDEGPVFSAGTALEGVFAAVCARQP